MKPAICISGICRGNVERNIENVKSHFPYDIFFATWEGCEKVIKNHGLSNENVVYFKEPKMHYHPILDPENVLSPKLKSIKKRMEINDFSLGKDYYTRTLNHTKQILIHNELLKKIPNEYDMIIRIRYDTFLSNKVNFHSYLEKSYKEGISIGFGTRTTRHKNIDVLYEIPKLYPYENMPATVSNDWGWYIMDPMIFHPRSIFDNKLVDKLHQEKKLLVAENGWYQVLSQPYGDNHLCVYGGAQIEKYLR